jgi:1A family penicillin-binding protein
MVLDVKQRLHLDVKHRLRLIRAWLRRDPAVPPPRWLGRRWPWAVLAVAVLSIGTLDAWLLSCGFAGCPSASEIRAFKPAQGGEIRDRNNRFLGRIANVRRVNVPLSAVPEHVRQAFIATEDRRFYGHNGLDWRGFFRSIARNVASLGFRQGFSTITMQVAENAFLLDRYNRRSLRRKMLELRYARLLEGQLSKDQILEHYLNVIYLGNGMYGVEAASRDLFGKPISRVTLTEGALLAGLPKAPSAYTPRRSERRAVQRRAVVLGLMADAGFISPDLAQRAARERLRISEEEWRPSTANEVLALDIVRAFVDSVLPDVLKEGDVTVYTTLDLTAQRAADVTVIRHAQALGRSIEGALVAMDPQSGDIRAVVGGRRTLRGGFNRAYNARRQPGSAFKPFVYAAALAQGMGPSTQVDDEPIELDIGSGRPWIPANFDDSYMGRVTFRRALAHSLNAATIMVSRHVGEERVIDVARRNGITRSPLRPVPSIALGALEVTPLELVTAYVPFANGGVRVKPRLVRRIEAPDGKVLWSQEVETQQVMDPREAYEMTSMLRAVVDYGSGRAIRDMGITAPVAGKTGTTNSGTDVWFIGYTPTLVAGIWFGYDQPRPINGGSASGGRIAAPAWAQFYARAWREPRGIAWYAPPNMVMRVIDPQTGELANEWCPARQREFFRPGHEPTEMCRDHSSPPLWHVEDPGDFDDDDPNAPVRRDDPWPEDVRREIGRVFRRIIRF